MNNLRKFVASSVIVMTAVSMSCVSLASASAQAGDLIKSAGSTTIYYLSSDGNKYPFADAATYNTWYKDTSGVVTVSADELASYATGVKILVRPGTKLVKKTTDKSVYAVEPNGVLRRIADPADAVALWGAKWGHNIIIISSLDGYIVGTQLESHQYTAGSLIKQNNVTYYFDGSVYQKFTSNSFAANKLSTTYVLTAPAGQVLLPLGADITGVQENLLAMNKANGGATVVNTGTALNVALASNTAAANTLIQGQASANLASFNFTNPTSGSVTVSSLKLKRIGVSGDSTLSNLYLYDGSTKLTDAGSLSSGYVTFAKGGGVFTVPANSTKTITVKADLSSTAAGTVGMSINAATDVVATGVVVGIANAPLNGNLMSTVTAPSDLATVVIGPATPTGTTNAINAGTIGATIWSAPFTVSQKAVTLNYLSFRQVGSISSDALQNIKLFVNGVQAGSAASINSDNKLIFDLTSAPITLNTGAQTVEVRADVVKGSSRTFSLVMQLASDVTLTDTNYNVNISPTSNSGINISSTTTINSGSISIAADPNFTATQVVKSSANFTIAQFTMKAYGEDMQVNNLIAKLTFTDATGKTGATTTEGINNLALYVNGAQVGSSQNFNRTSGVFPTYSTVTGTSLVGAASYGINNLFTIPAGQTYTIAIKGDLNQLSTTALGTVYADLILAASQAQGVSSVTTYPSSAITTLHNQTLSVVSGGLTPAANGAFQSQYVVKNTAQQKIGSYILQASSAEGVRISNLQVKIGGDISTNDLNNLYVTNNTTPVAPSASNNFPVNFTIAANATQVIDVYADLGNVSAGTTVTTSLAVTAVGASTNNALSGSVVGQTLTIQTGALAVPTLVSNDPTSQLVLGGTTNKVASYKFVASNGAATISELWFNISQNATATPNTDGVMSVTVGGVSAPVVAGAVHLTGLNIAIPAGVQGVNVPVTATLNSVTSANMGGAPLGRQVKVVLTDYKYSVGSVTAQASDTVSLAVASNVMLMTSAVPTISLAPDNPAGMSTGYTGSGASELLRFTVSNNASHPINLKALTLTPVFTLTNLTSTSTQMIKIYDKDDLSVVLNGSASGTAIGNSGSKNRISLDNDFTIPGNTSKTLVVKADTTGTWGTAGQSIRLDLTNSDTIAGQVTSGDWLWNDSTSVATNYLNGYLVKNLPLTGNTFVK